MKENDVAIVVPALNEELSIISVIKSVEKYGRLIVVSDGSIDATAELALAEGAIVIVNPVNLGYEISLEIGLQAALDRGFKYAITMDADGQHDPDVIQKIISEFNGDCELILGYREKMQRFGESLFSVVGRLKWGIRDPLCGVKGYRLDLLKKYGPFRTFNSIGVEFAIKLISLKIKFKEVNVQTKPRNGESRFGSGITANMRIISALVRLL